MIISRTPFRMSFFGGGTDYPAWFKHNGGGKVLATTIDKYCYITCRYLPPFFDYRTRVVWSKVEMVPDNAHIEHPVIRAALKYLKIPHGVEIHHVSDLPARAGLGSSSSFAVGSVHALLALKNEMPDKMRLAREAIKIEQVILKENVGCQDQTSAAFGGFNRIDFQPNGQIHVDPVTVGAERLSYLHSHLLLYFTGFSRIASQIVKEQLSRIKDTKKELRQMGEMVDEGVKILTGNGTLDPFGKLLHESWKLKRSLSSKISLPLIDETYEAARAEGALGGKILGAGGGGFMLLFAKPQDHPRIRRRLRKLMRIPFNFENDGSRIILYEPDVPYEKIAP